MDAADLREAVEDDKRTELDRIGSSKFLIAATDADLEAEPVLRAAADSEHAAAETFAAWADDEDDAAAAEAFAAVAEQEREHYDRVADHLPDDFEPADGGPMHAYLRGRDDGIERVAGGLLGRPLVSVRSHTQVISFFVNEADEAMANLFRELKTETNEELERGLDLLDDRCADADDWERARSVAAYTIQVAYDDYADSLTELGVDPRPIC
ncbi:rubrerythrin family protein [Halostella litorea]|uniref:rubrerythrin family protein n=1 Tax=Halostella litorea TaxID=2528831 RepID=UPI001092F616|nr:rubrerythrin family protein [Halostella litorea]